MYILAKPLPILSTEISLKFRFSLPEMGEKQGEPIICISSPKETESVNLSRKISEISIEKYL